MCTAIPLRTLRKSCPHLTSNSRQTVKEECSWSHLYTRRKGTSPGLVWQTLTRKYMSLLSSTTRSKLETHLSLASKSINNKRCPSQMRVIIKCRRKGSRSSSWRRFPVCHMWEDDRAPSTVIRKRALSITIRKISTNWKTGSAKRTKSSWALLRIKIRGYPSRNSQKEWSRSSTPSTSQRMPKLSILKSYKKRCIWATLWA